MQEKKIFKLELLKIKVFMRNKNLTIKLITIIKIKISKVQQAQNVNAT